ncbi:methionyl-tRNA formyltransferase [Dysgonomonas sp. 520]|uniref:methionyl-tRNA formyltransferase n=1 Tax=Dysgonomonas sp. 520 TaxID=2302931 RepID=UPI0013D08A66|nr:methionyl-tRNA formyltransferase [Dysgonomonas sp. 520]NDW09383.1 methionyl-tRNA formyltransferase [Dysgonomonas sp. 520]
MRKEDLRIVFMGTPDFAVETLKVLVENKYNVVGVITMPDKPSGRGHKIQYSAVKKYALDNNLPILQPEKLKDETFLSELREWKADLQIVVAFRMLPEVVWNMPPQGTFNLHASLLPQYRGAAPINWAIINGEKETGATTFFLTHEIDTGKIILQEKVAIGETDNVGKIHDELMLMGAQLVRKTVDIILSGQVDAIDQSKYYQNEEDLKTAPKIFKETCRIDWNQPAEKIYNLIRGLSPYPVAWTELCNDKDETQPIKIFSATIIMDENHQMEPGSMKTDNKSYIHIACKDGFMNVQDIQLAGKKMMKTSELLNGFKFAEGSYFK